jgi:hypothetical protein
MFKVDADNVEESIGEVSTVSLEKFECSGLTYYIAAVTSFARTIINVINSRSNSSTGEESTMDATLPSLDRTQLASRLSIVTPHRYSLSNIPDCIIAGDFYDSKSSSATTQSTGTAASYGETFLFTYSSNSKEDQMQGLESISTASNLPKNCKNTALTKEIDYDTSTIDNVQLTTIATTAANGNGFRNVRRYRNLCGGKITKASARILQLPRDIAFDSSCDSSMDDDGHDLSYNL